MSIVLSPVAAMKAVNLINKVNTLLHPPRREDCYTNLISLFQPNKPMLHLRANQHTFTVTEEVNGRDVVVFEGKLLAGVVPVVSTYIQGEWEDRILNA